MATKKVSRKGSELATNEAFDPREFRKTNDAIGLRVKEGKLSLLSRKLFNVMMFHAQQLKEPGRNAPIDTAASKKYFWIPLAEVARDARYDSKDTANLKEQLDALTNLKLYMENERQWTSERLVASITFVNPAGLRNRHAGQVWFGFSFPPEVHEIVLSPGTFTHLSIFYQGLLRSGPALSLYEACRRHATNPSKRTAIQSYPHWYAVITGTPVDLEKDPLDQVPPYKYFKRDTLKPAIAEINALTDIQIELIEHKNGRRIEQLQFYVEMSRQAPLAFPAPPVIDTELLEKVVALGFAPNDASDLIARNNDEKVRACLAFVEKRMNAKGGQPLDSPAAYFRWALKDGAGAGLRVVAQQKVGQEKPSGSAVMQQFLETRAKEALDVYRELDDSERQATLARFSLQAGKAVARIERGAEHPMVRALLGKWYAQELWGEPDAQALAMFIEQVGIPARAS